MLNAKGRSCWAPSRARPDPQPSGQKCVLSLPSRFAQRRDAADVRCSSSGRSGPPDPAMRIMVERLKKSFYDTASIAERELSQAESASLPLFLASRAVTLPGQQRILHIHQPIYLHMMDALLRGPQPWLVGQVRSPPPGDLTPQLEKASQQPSPGQPADSPSDKPAVGVIMEISRVVRLPTGALVMLCTATHQRFEVRWRRDFAKNCVPWGAELQPRPLNSDSTFGYNEHYARAGASERAEGGQACAR